MQVTPFEGTHSSPIPIPFVTLRTRSEIKNKTPNGHNGFPKIKTRGVEQGICKMSRANPESTPSKGSSSSFTTSMNTSQRLLSQAEPLKQHKLRIREEKSKEGIKSISRVVLMDWLMLTTHQMQVDKQTLHDAIYFFDQVQACIPISKKEYQLYAVCCLSIAHKLQCSRPIPTAAILELLSRDASSTDLKQAEIAILTALKFRLTPFTMWREANLLLRAWQAFSSHWLLTIDLRNIKNRLFWMVDAICMLANHDGYPFKQKLICLCLLHYEIQMHANGLIGWQHAFNAFTSSILEPQQLSKPQKQQIQSWILSLRSMAGQQTAGYDPLMKEAVARLVFSI